MKKKLFLFPMLAAVAIICFGYNCINTATMQDNKGYVPEKGFVPDRETAVKIAEAVWFPIYGSVIENEKPFIAELKGNIWTVTGTLNSTKGGVAYIEIQKSDCRILKVTHGK